MNHSMGIACAFTLRCRWPSAPIVAVLALALWAGCAKTPVAYERSATGASAPAPRPVPTPGAPGTGLSRESGPPGGALTPGAPGGAARSEGATADRPLVGAQRPAPAEFSAMAALKDVYFDFDRYVVRPDAVEVLTANAAWLKSHPGTAVLVEGHCDERGTSEYNLALGQRRAQSVRDFLLAQGIPAGRIATISYGEERPVCTEATEECRARNRRAHFLIKPS